jgi:hypothetical protein
MMTVIALQTISSITTVTPYGVMHHSSPSDNLMDRIDSAIIPASNEDLLTSEISRKKMGG